MFVYCSEFEGVSNILIEGQNVENLSKSSKRKVLVKCDYCGVVYYAPYISYIHGMECETHKTACMNCKTKKKNETTLWKRRESFYRRLTETCEEMGYILLSPKEDITCNTSYIEYECPKHGTFSMRVANMLNGKGCPKCAKEKASRSYRMDSDTVIREIEKCGGKLCNPEDYKNNTTKNLKIICPECGNEFITSLRNFTQHGGQVCGRCSESAESVGERTIRYYLDDNGIEYKQEYWFSDCRDINPLPFDFYIPSKSLIIEFDGRQHFEETDYFSYSYEKTKRHDEIKNNYCREHSINIVRIPYWKIGKVDKILDEALSI